MKFKVFLMMIIASFFCIAGVNAETINVSAGEDLNAKVASASSGDTIVIANGTYTGDVTIDKDITLSGASKTGVIVDGSIIVTANAMVNLENLTIQDNGYDVAMVDLQKPANVTIDNCKIAYKGYSDSDYGNSDYAVGVKLGRDVANGSSVEIYNSEIYAKYGVWVYGADNYVYIENSEITGWAPLDISNGASARTLASDNYVEVYNSTLTGVATLTGTSNAYGTVVIGGQSGLALYIDDSTVTNKFVANNTQDLIVFGNSYLDSENVLIAISNSDLINTASAGNNSAVYNIGTAENASLTANNVLVTDSVNMTANNGKVYNTIAGNINVSVDDSFGGLATMTVPAGTIFNDIPFFTELIKEFDLPAYEGYIFNGLYTSSDYTTEFDGTVPLNTDTTVYAKFTEAPQEEIEDNQNTASGEFTGNYNDINQNLDDVPYTGDLFSNLGLKLYVVK